MAKKSTENQTKKRSGSKKARRQERFSKIALGMVVLTGVLLFAVIRVLESQDTSANEWVMADGETEILAAPMEQTMEIDQDDETTLETDEDSDSSLPFFDQDTDEDGDEDAVGPVATPEPEQPEVGAEATVEPTGVSITITAVGDCTLGGDIPSGAYRRFQSYVEEYGYDYFFENVRELFESDDLTIVNLEGPLTTSDNMRSGRTFNFRGYPEYVNILSGSSVEIANIANNHSMDYGEEGFTETAEVLTEAGIGASGFSLVYYTEVKGVTVGSIGFTEWAYSQEQIEQAIRDAKEECDLLIVSVHWGEEKSHTATSSQKKLGRAMIDAGADIVIGNHSHVYGGIELYEGKYIIYSLGNFCFGGNKNPSEKDCTIFQQTFVISDDGTVSDGGINIIPARVSGQDDTNDYQPYILTGDKAVTLLKKIASVSDIDETQLLWMEDSAYEDALETLDNAA